MSEIRYLISDASKKVDVETHVLRYWEEELGLSIPRNEMGHRYYTEFHIRLFCQIKKLKDRGYQLKAIKNALQQVMGKNQGFMQAAGILEEDMARTLQENQPLIFIKDKEGRFENITRLADYNRLEYANEELLIPEKHGIKGDNERALKENNQEKMQNKPEIKEKDGQTEMKKKGKNRKKPSAWERRNGITGKEQDISREWDKENFYEEVFPKIKLENTIQDKNAPQTYVQEGAVQQKEAQENTIQDKTMPQTHVQEESVQQKEEGENTIQDKMPPQTCAQEEMVQQNDVQEEQNRQINLPEKNEINPQINTDVHLKSDTTALARASAEPSSAFLLTEQDDKMQQFQNIMNHIIGHALEANNEKLSREISNLVNERLSEELEDLMRIRDERDEERFRQFDEIIRSYQRESQGKAEAAAAKIPFFKRGRFKKNRHSQNA